MIPIKVEYVFALREHRMKAVAEHLERERKFTFCFDDKIVSEFAYELVIPNIFIRDLLADCINGYLIECKIENKLPFGNNSILRKHRLTWYDK